MMASYGSLLNVRFMIYLLHQIVVACYIVLYFNETRKYSINVALIRAFHTSTASDHIIWSHLKLYECDLWRNIIYRGHVCPFEVKPYGDREPGQHQLRKWLIAWWHQCWSTINGVMFYLEDQFQRSILIRKMVYNHYRISQGPMS